MDSHTLSSPFQYTSQQKLHVQQLSKNGSLSVAYVRRRSTAPVCFTVLIARGAYCRSSDARNRPWRIIGMELLGAWTSRDSVILQVTYPLM